MRLESRIAPIRLIDVSLERAKKALSTDIYSDNIRNHKRRKSIKHQNKNNCFNSPRLAVLEARKNCLAVSKIKPTKASVRIILVRCR